MGIYQRVGRGIAPHRLAVLPSHIQTIVAGADSHDICVSEAESVREYYGKEYAAYILKDALFFGGTLIKIHYLPCRRGNCVLTDVNRASAEKFYFHCFFVETQDHPQRIFFVPLSVLVDYCADQSVRQVRLPVVEGTGSTSLFHWWDFEGEKGWRQIKKFCLSRRGSS